MPVKYPEEIQKLIDIFEPFMVGCHLENAPKEAIEAAEKFKKWAWKREWKMSSHQSGDWWYFYTQF